MPWSMLRCSSVSSMRKMKIPLLRCKGFSEEAKYLTMRGALAMDQGHYHRAYAALSRSLKLDKSIGETHALLADYYHHRGDETAAQNHRKWLRRNS